MTNNDSILLLDRKLGICQRKIGRVNKLIDYCVPLLFLQDQIHKMLSIYDEVCNEMIL